MAQSATDAVLDCWKTCDPSGAYQAGFIELRGKMIVPRPDVFEQNLAKIDEVRGRLKEIEREDLWVLCEKLLNSLELDLRIQSPDKFVGQCFMSLWFTLLMDEQKLDEKSFEAVTPLLKQTIEVLELESERWSDRDFSGEVIKATVDNCNSLEFMLSTLEGLNLAPADLFNEVRLRLTDFRKLFPFPVKDESNFDQVFAFLKEKSKPAKVNEFYARILTDVFDFGASAQEIEDTTLPFLESALKETRDLLPELSLFVDGVTPDTPLGKVYELLTEKYKIKEGEVLDQAKMMMEVINSFVDRFVQDLGEHPDIEPIQAPNFLTDLITSGATVPLNFATDKPRSIIYINEDKNTSFLTLLNVLVHEATHAYHPLILATVPDLPRLATLKLPYTIPFSEATAFHREFELFESLERQSERGRHNAVQQKLIDLFDLPAPSLSNDVLAFKFETFYWRIIRAVRTLCDVRVNTGKSTYVEFLEWASKFTGFSKSTINDECFTFLSAPGYMPSYSFCGSEYETLENQASNNGLSEFDFNTRANKMGIWPWTICLQKMRNFQKATAAT